ncbi:endonuclease/exonuclease/phosphatase family protein [Congregibacter variabilis]|uniref:Endonuclease/exonuclease/phosphatase family protein n=1 Tax=Congregibacter variabilis TaxID=3081200 RepID=A0ABZ0I0S7_9GAMM|nr:endonuclease/exonuclease/phosphatase family protein [Congregibacter sp. IMCC43200]
MIGRIEALLRRVRRALSRSEWLARILGLPSSKDTDAAPGLVLIQIDGLSQPELENALRLGEMPFLRRLLHREHYEQIALYSGIPSSTAAFQAELFYGVKTAVPGFSFRESETGQMVRMFETAAAARVEQRLVAQGGEGLLKGGSCYVDNYTGGAQEPHFCPTSHGWGPALRDASPVALILLVLSNTYSFLRIGVLFLTEILLAVTDFFRGLIRGHSIFRELTFVPTRVAVSIVLRELTTIGVKIDIARGLPVIHLNFLGYDEQAHRRGPSSKFAHWTLKGIDDAVARIWRATQRSSRRSYELWVYSDHGQEKTQSYAKIHGTDFGAVAARIYSGETKKPRMAQADGVSGLEMNRARYVGGKRIQKILRTRGPESGAYQDSQISLTLRGPVSMIYIKEPLSAVGIQSMAEALISDADVPMVLAKETSGRARAWTSKGEFSLPEEAAAVLGDDHPFLADVTRDLIALAHHCDAGTLIAFGWCLGREAISFALENGAHGGAGPKESNGFVLLPDDVELRSAGRSYARPLDLRRAVLRELGRSSSELTLSPRRSVTPPKTVRVMTYNVHSCIGMDGKLSPERIARVINRYAPDVIALQELDVGRLRTGGIDQAQLIANQLEMSMHFHASVHMEEERYGDAILTRFPMRLVKAGLLPGLPKKPALEPRGALWVAIDVDGTELQVMNTHLGLYQRERKRQVEALLSDQWLGHPQCRGPLLLCGDFNAMPSSTVCKKLQTRLVDAQIELESHRPKNTFFGRFPTARIDHIYVDPAIGVSDIEVPSSALVRVASDHLPLIAELTLPEAGL